jgi:holo-[acyl-carrier protein] synthase
MKIFGIGIDVIEVERIEEALKEFGDRFLDRVFTAEERAYCSKQNRPELHYAARWAAKEAVSKAFGTGIGLEVAWTEVEVLRGEAGEPSLRLHGAGKKFAEREGIKEVKISLTHAKHYAAANAVAMAE